MPEPKMHSNLSLPELRQEAKRTTQSAVSGGKLSAVFLLKIAESTVEEGITSEDSGDLHVAFLKYQQGARCAPSGYKPLRCQLFLLDAVFFPNHLIHSISSKGRGNPKAPEQMILNDSCNYNSNRYVFIFLVFFFSFDYTERDSESYPDHYSTIRSYRAQVATIRSYP
jgi:hypothetical protein